ncbi:4-oxalocrotonate tautomerase family protein [Mesorhizobium sp. M0700]|uniref:tautomerase family protein n=1 Tax=Mesorhizobium sp. M0700 TaxID=2956988 RepID=UPI0033353FB7
MDTIEDALDVIMIERNSHHRRSNLASTAPGLGLKIVEAMFCYQPARQRATKEQAMPVIHIETFKSDDDKKAQLVAEITKLFCDKMNLRPEQIHVVFDEYEPNNWATGGKLWSRM